MMAQVVKGVVAEELDTNALFEKYTVEEIRGIEKKTRSDIEKKKEELRMMVGERYRDLIEAADTITEMKNSAENVMQSIGRMQELCQQMKQTHMIKGFHVVSKPPIELKKKREENQFYSIASEIKLLLDMPEKIWSALDSRSYLQATQMYLLSRHIHTSMQIGAGVKATQILSWFPVLARTWAAISHFRDVILQACKETLKNISISDDEAAECLCSLLLLEDSTSDQVFDDYLTISMTAVQQLFQVEQTSLSVKDQICGVVQMIVRTIHQVYVIFSDKSSSGLPEGVDSNLLMNKLSKVMEKGKEGMLLGDGQTQNVKYLPNAVREFQPALKKKPVPVTEKYLQEKCQKWVETCINTVSQGLTQLLDYITTVKNLSGIRMQVWELLNEDPRMKTWDHVCSNTLQRNILIWDEFFQPHFQKRANALLQAQYERALSTCKQQVAHVLRDLAAGDRSSLAERDVSSYIWIEGSADMPANMAWVTIGSKTLADAGTLTMKAKAYTPAIQSLCRNFDTRLKTLLEDAGHYLKPTNVNQSGTFDQYSDTPAVLTFIQDSCGECVDKLLTFLQNQLHACKQQVNSTEDHVAAIMLLDSILLLGRLSSAISELCIHLQQSMIGSTEKIELRRLGKRPALGKASSKNFEHPRWLEVKGKMKHFSEECFRFWADFTGIRLAKNFTQTILDSSGQAVLRGNLNWDIIEIQEESEDGKSMKSKIRVPMQPSWFITSTLYQLSEELGRVGGQAIMRSIPQKLVWTMTDMMLTSYETVCQSKRDTKEGKSQTMPLTQNRALQLLFDIRLMSNVLPRKEECKENSTYQKRLQKVIDMLESEVDPFDLDVFMPHINMHLNRQTQRFTVLLGSLMLLDKHGMYVTQRQSLSTQEPHNILPLSSNQNKLPLLPLSIQNRTSMVQPIVQPPKSKSMPVLDANMPPPDIPMPRNESTGFLANMSTLWFSNVSKK